ncbi:hypothetical protein ACGF7W_38385 [Streptomyces sp. NPDC048219]|uniref:hypothetical protein n=1 Tax=unclassified Streptomyces TaxID=2593676 RepID=UPI00342983E5
MTGAPGGFGSGCGAAVLRAGGGAEGPGVFSAAGGLAGFLVAEGPAVFSGVEGLAVPLVAVGLAVLSVAGGLAVLLAAEASGVCVDEERPGVAFVREGAGAWGLGVVLAVRPAVGVAAPVRGGVGAWGRGLAPAREGGVERWGVARGVRAAALVRGRDGAGSCRADAPGREGAAEPGGTTPGVRPVVGTAPVARGRDVRSPGGAGGRGPAGVVRAGTVVRVGLGRAVLDTSGDGVKDGSGTGVGRERSTEADGAGAGVPPSCATHAHTPTPPRTSTAAPPTTHGARRGGRR